MTKYRLASATLQDIFDGTYIGEEHRIEDTILHLSYNRVLEDVLGQI